MNLLLDYKKKILKNIKILEKKKIIKIPTNLKNFTIELAPLNQRADISCNAAMILAKANNSSPVKLAEILIQEALQEIAKHKTTIVIAHRLSTIRKASLIYVFDKDKD